MPVPLSVLLIEDSDSDADLIRYQLEKAGFEITIERVETAEAMQSALVKQGWDIVISDYNLPNFSAPAALAILQKTHLDIPFIVASGTISEETALDLMRSGAADYLMKDRLARLGALVKRELNIAQVRRERQEAQAALQKSEEWSNLIYNTTSDFMFLLAVEPDHVYRCLTVNAAYLHSTGLSENQVVGKRLDEVIPPQNIQFSLGKYQEAISVGHPIQYEETFELSKGWVTVETTLTPVMDQNGQCTHLLGSSHEITERRRAEEALKESEANFRVFFETIDDIIVVATPKGNILYGNTTLERKLGYAPEELSNMHVLDLNPADKRQEAEAIFAAIFRGERTTCPLPLVTKNNVLVPVEMRAWFGKWNGIDCIFGVAKDLSSEQEAQQRFEQLFRNNPTLMVLSSIPERKFTDVNKAFIATLGYTQEEILGKTSAEIGLFVNPQEQGAIAAQLQACGRINGFELQLRRKDGAVLDGLFSGEIISSQGKEYFLTVIVDITERKLAEKNLLESERHFRSLFEQAAVGMAMTDARSGEFLKINQRFCEILGYTADEMKGVTFKTITHPDDVQISLEKMKLLLAGTIREFSMEKRYLRKDGSDVWVDLNVSSMWESDEPPTSYVTIVQDITERKRLETAFESRLIALTRPLDEPEDLDFDDLFDLKTIQRLQDEFAIATGVASIITHPDGTPITKPSNFCRLCSDIIRKTEKGRINCFKSDAEIGHFHPEGYIIQPCLSGGLWDAGAGISVGGRHIANWLIGQVRDESQSEAKILEYAHTIGADETLVVDAFLEVPAMSQLQFQRVAQVLFTMANQLSSIAYQNIQQARFITESRLSEEAIKASETRWRAVFENAGMGIVLVSQDGHLTQSNAAFQQMLGYSGSELINRTIADVTHPEDNKKDRQMFSNAVKTQGKFQIEKRYIRKDGQIIWGNLIVTVFGKESGHPGYSLGIIEDVTERKRTEEALRESELKLSSIIKKSRDAIGVSKLGVHVLANPAYVSMFGYDSEAEVLNKSVLDLIAPSQRTQILNKIRQRARGEPVSEFYITRGLRKDSSEFDMEVTVSTYELNAEFYTLVINRDITERRQIEESLRLSEEKFFTAFRISPDAINITCFKDGLYTEVNEGFCNLTGYTAEEVIGKSSIDLTIWVNPQDREKLVRELQEHGEMLNLEASFRAKNGQIKICLTSTRMIELNQEKYALSITRDITDRKQVEQALRESEERYQLIDEASQDLIYSYDRQSRFTHANASMCSVLGLKAEQIVGKTHEELGFSQELCNEWSRLHQQVYATNTTVIAETMTPIKEGNPQYFEVVLNPIHDESGAIIGIAGTTRDINARKIAEAKINEQIEELHRWHNATMGREDRILQLKKEVNRLLTETGKPPRYVSALEYPDA